MRQQQQVYYFKTFINKSKLTTDKPDPQILDWTARTWENQQQIFQEKRIPVEFITMTLLWKLEISIRENITSLEQDFI